MNDLVFNFYSPAKCFPISCRLGPRVSQAFLLDPPLSKCIRYPKIS